MTTAADVLVGVTGGVYIADADTAIPTDAVTALSASFVEVGYLSEDGISQAINEDITDLKAWQNADVVRKIQTSHDLTYSFTMIETSDVTLEAFYGNYAAGAVEISGDQLPHHAWVLSVIDDTNIIRIAIPDGQITERGDLVLQNGDAIGYPVTITCFPDDSGNKAYLYVSGTGS